MATAKQEVQKVLDTFPRKPPGGHQYHLYVLQRIERGRADMRRAGRVIPREEVERRMNSHQSMSISDDR